MAPVGWVDGSSIPFRPPSIQSRWSPASHGFGVTFVTGFRLTAAPPAAERSNSCAGAIHVAANSGALSPVGAPVGSQGCA